MAAKRSVWGEAIVFPDSLQKYVCICTAPVIYHETLLNGTIKWDPYEKIQVGAAQLMCALFMTAILQQSTLLKKSCKV